jgi:hypothetical protein
MSSGLMPCGPYNRQDELASERALTGGVAGMCSSKISQSTYPRLS